jgi:hypothetical protein
MVGFVRFCNFDIFIEGIVFAYFSYIYHHQLALKPSFSIATSRSLPFPLPISQFQPSPIKGKPQARLFTTSLLGCRVIHRLVGVVGVCALALVRSKKNHKKGPKVKPTS